MSRSDRPSPSPVLGPGATLGFLGGGQLARMMALEGRRMGYRVAVVDRAPDGPASPVADVWVHGPFEDRRLAGALADVADVVTLDTEHVPVALLERLAEKVPVRPGAAIVSILQDRGAQRRFLADHGLPQTDWAAVDDRAGLDAALARVGAPAVLKSRRSGYDGKGQARLRGPEDAEAAWAAIGGVPATLEAFVDFELEISALVARDAGGRMRVFPIAENEHRHHVLHLSIAPARVPAELAEAAGRLAERIADALDHVGVLAVELFVTRSGGLLVNEVAARVHNSGHYSFGGCVTSQFEQHLRAVCGLPLGDPSLLRPTVMLNLLGDLWRDGEPDWASVLADPDAKLHLYGKAHASPGRKMGHVLFFDEDVERALARAEACHRRLSGEG